MVFSFLWEGSRGGHVVGRFIIKRHQVTSCRSAKLKQIFGNTRQTHD